jgi:uncharacterized protein YdgA (DUF945 family)
MLRAATERPGHGRPVEPEGCMRKVFIALVVVVLIAVLATPLAGGILARRAHAVLVENLGQVEASSMGAVRITSEGFDLGWLSSKARMRVTVGASGSSYEFPLVHVVHHGPLPVARATRGLSLAIIDTTVEGATLPDGNVPFRGETVIGMTGDLGVDLQSLALPRRQEIAWEGGTAQIQVKEQGKRIALQASAPRFELHGAPGDVVLESLKVDYTAERTPEGANTGAASYALGRARLASQSPERNVALDGFSWSSRSALNPAGKLDSSFVMRLAGLDIDDSTYRNVGFDLSLRNLDEAAIQALNEIGRQLSQVATSGLPVDQLALQLQSTLMFQMQGLLRSATEIELKGGHVETLDGPLDAELRLQRDPAASTDSEQALQVEGRIALPLPLFAALTLRVAEQISPSARQAGDAQALDFIADEIAARLLTQGYVKEEDDGRLSTEISYRENAIMLNGRPLSLGNLIAGQSGSLQ